MAEGRTGGGRPTIYDVAREAGVSPSTVSRVMSRPGRVNAVTAARVAEVAARLGYRTNPLARALPSGRTDTLALFVSDITNPHFFGVIRGAEHQARAAGCTLIVGDTEESPEVEARNIERLGPSVDGFVIAASRMSDAEITDLAAGHRLALVSRQVAGVPSVIVDHAEGTRQIVEHLASLGHRSLVFLGGPPRSWLGARRWESLAAAADRHGIAVRRIGPFPRPWPAAAPPPTPRSARAPPPRSRTTTCSPSASCAAARNGAWPCPATSASSATTTSSARTSARRR
ncbi:LacI family DNA-binding transcriptional regulator [Actinomadura sp. WMMB 499]|uniref:LacI family DNA-binding transcriptional regulator n=1 Tax=Actinomadura sp. WMMB 499 TaxID=1219491 RepID=UPI0034A0CD9D